VFMGSSGGKGLGCRRETGPFANAKARFALLTGSSADNRQNLLQAEILPLFIVWSGSAYTRK